jgi:hypothetical protein
MLDVARNTSNTTHAVPDKSRSRNAEKSAGLKVASKCSIMPPQHKDGAPALSTLFCALATAPKAH